jgi:hypothetical protein
MTRRDQAAVAYPKRFTALAPSRLEPVQINRDAARIRTRLMSATPLSHLSEQTPARSRVRRTGKCTEFSANRSDQEAATVDHQSLAGHEGLSH